jgi:hypothetical protein
MVQREEGDLSDLHRKDEAKHMKAEEREKSAGVTEWLPPPKNNLQVAGNGDPMTCCFGQRGGGMGMTLR